MSAAEISLEPAAAEVSRARRRLIGFAITPSATIFAPTLFAGRLEHGIRFASDLGMTCIELNVRDPRTMDVSWLRGVLAASDIAVSAIATGQACGGDGLCLSAKDASVRAAAVSRFRQQAVLAAQLEATVILGSVRGRIDEPAHQKSRWRETCDAIATCLEFAPDQNVDVVFEPINRYETNLVNSAAEAMELILDLKVPNLKLLLDAFHMNIEEVSFGNVIREAGDLLGYFHLVDSNRSAPGQGHVNFDEILDALEDIGYTGPLVAEILPYPDDVTAAQHTADFFRSGPFPKGAAR